MVSSFALVYCKLICTFEIGAIIDGEKAEMKLVVESSAAPAGHVAFWQLKTAVPAVVKRTS